MEGVWEPLASALYQVSTLMLKSFTACRAEATGDSEEKRTQVPLGN